MDQEAHCPFILEGSLVFSGPCPTYPDLSINGFESRLSRHRNLSTGCVNGRLEPHDRDGLSREIGIARSPFLLNKTE